MVYPIGDGNQFQLTHKAAKITINLMVYPIGDGNTITASITRNVPN